MILASNIIPQVISWESTLACNFRCRHCGLNCSTARNNELTTIEAKEMLDQISQFKVPGIVISGGEFTLRSDWIELLQYALNSLSVVRIITNCHLGGKIIPILESLENSERLVLSVSLDGMFEYHDYQRQKGSFQKVREILEFPTRIPKVILTTVDKNNFSDLEDVFQLCLENNVNAWVIQLCLPAGRMDPQNFIGAEQIPKLVAQIEKWQKIFVGKMEVVIDDCFAYFHPIRKSPWLGCHAGSRLIHIKSDGQVTGCPTLLFSDCGNIKGQSLAEIYYSEEMEKIRNYKPIQCRNCNQCLGGCRAVSETVGQMLCKN
jgi:MoaA/NifB/PqqE/SkfB family radical SAM enzyme